MKSCHSRLLISHKFVSIGLTTLAVAVINVALWFVMYDNSISGTLVLLGLSALNAVILAYPWNRWDQFISPQHIRAAAVSFCSLWLVFLLLEFIFPIIASKEYAQMVDLSNRFLKNRRPDSHKADVVFLNNFEPIVDGQNENGPIFWHVPGKRYIYYGYEPNLKKNYENHVTWNSSGYFDKEYPRSKPDQTFRIVVIGDSYVESVQVPLQKTFHKRLEQSLNSNTPVSGYKKFEVIALGSSGAGQNTNFMTLSKQAAALNPDAVIITFCSNDICDDDHVLKNELDLFSSTLSPMIRKLLTNGYFAPAFALKRINDIKLNNATVSPELLQWSSNLPEKVRRAWKNCLDSIMASKSFCDSKGILFLLVYLGSDIETKFALSPDETVSRLKSMGTGYENLEWDFQQSLKTLREFSMTNRINFLSLQGPLETAQSMTGLFVFGDHYSIFGHKVASIAMECALRKLIENNSHGSLLFELDDCEKKRITDN